MTPQEGVVTGVAVAAMMAMGMLLPCPGLSCPGTCNGNLPNIIVISLLKLASAVVGMLPCTVVSDCEILTTN